VDPSWLLMVGDSFEDVEVGNAAGTATCLIAGGGNEKPGAAGAPPPRAPAGAVATMAVSGLPELQRLLEAASGKNPAGSPAGSVASAGLLRPGWPAREAAGEVVGEEGSPSPGLDFVDWCLEGGGLRSGGASFPRIGEHAGGLATCSDRGERGHEGF
jgi:hypothetical protein